MLPIAIGQGFYCQANNAHAKAHNSVYHTTHHDQHHLNVDSQGCEERQRATHVTRTALRPESVAECGANAAMPTPRCETTGSDNWPTRIVHV